jgi:hypothetical protein
MAKRPKEKNPQMKTKMVAKLQFISRKKRGDKIEGRKSTKM